MSCVMCLAVGGSDIDGPTPSSFCLAYLLLADPGKARECSTKSVIIDSLGKNLFE